MHLARRRRGLATSPAGYGIDARTCFVQLTGVLAVVVARRDGPAAVGARVSPVVEPVLCWLLHRWGPWTNYEAVRPVRVIGPALRHLVTVTETRRRRRCGRCGEVDDRLVAERAVDSERRLLGHGEGRPAG
jgi:hypothetical protein